jgi:hypothetical protein
MKYYLGRNRSAFDPRDYSLAAFMPRTAGNLAVAPDTSWAFPVAPLDQGETGHCVGFSMANWGINLPVQDNYTNQDGHDFYYKCKVVDGEPGAEDGSNVRAAAKVLRQMGKISNYAFASSINEIKYWLVNNGPLIIGTDWTNDMFNPDIEGIVHPTGDIAGGHAYLCNEVKGDTYLGFQNSWGAWGLNWTGKFYMLISEFVTLFRSGGEACAAVELTTPIPSQENPGCLAALLNLFK